MQSGDCKKGRNKYHGIYTNLKCLIADIASFYGPLLIRLYFADNERGDYQEGTGKIGFSCDCFIVSV